MQFNTDRARACLPTHDLPRSLSRIASAIALTIASLSLSFAAQAQSASTIEGIFVNADSAPDWTISGHRYGSPRMPTMDGSGWLRLAGNIDAALGQVEANAKLASGVPIRVEFDHLIWGGSFDGLTVYFADANAPAAGRNGEVGGGLGYCGMNGAFLGIGIDDGGNFAQRYCGIGRFGQPGPQQGTAASGPGVRGNSVTVRGPASGMYPHVTSVSMNDLQDICVTCTDRNQAMKAMRHVEIEMVPRTPASSGYTLSMKVNGQDILRNVDYPYAPPKELVMGLASTTGAYGANHEIRNLKLSVQGPVTAVNCLNGVEPSGRCRPVDNPLGSGWDTVWVMNGKTQEVLPPELTDGDFAQSGWNGAAPWSNEAPSLSGGCMDMYLTHASGEAIDQVIVASRQDDWQHAVDPTESTTFTKYGAVDFTIQYQGPDNADWTNLPNGIGEVVGNDKVLRIFDLPTPATVWMLKVIVCRTADDNTSPLTEIVARKRK